MLLNVTPCFSFAPHKIFIQNTSAYISMLILPNTEKRDSGMFREWLHASVVSEQFIKLFLCTAHRSLLSEVFSVRTPYMKVENKVMIPLKIIPIV
jgi:hypothetical protein